jgi:Ca2+-binding RTX toxin-like protein
MHTNIIHPPDRTVWRLRPLLAALLTVSVIASTLVGSPTRADAVTDPNPSFEILPSDLEFILKQIKISENHAAGGDLLCPTSTDTSGTCVPHPMLPWGLRTVDGSFNNLLPGQSKFGAADQIFKRLLPVQLRDAEATPPFAPGNDSPTPGPMTSYKQTSGFTYDSQPRVISNLIVDLTTKNPAAVAVAEKVEGSEIDEDGRIFIPNEAPDEGLSAPFNNWMTFFGQFFDHGLDLVSKGGSGTVVIPLKAGDDLYREGSRTNFIQLTRATNMGTASDTVRNHKNKTTPFVDQNQTYTSHPSHQVFLREYDANGNATGHLLDGADGGLANWAEVKEQAQRVLGVALDDHDVVNVPLLRTDPYGNVFRGPNGFAQYATSTGFVNADGGPVPEAALRTGHSFLDDIAHAAAPFSSRGDRLLRGTREDLLTPLPAGQFDGDLLDAHFITGDGRGNENIGLTAVHHIFHAEHNRVARDIERVLTANPALKTRYQSEGANPWTYGQRLFQAARFVTEMEYQHLVFEEFGRTISPFIDVVPNNESGYHTDLDAAITAEFAHVVYRFGHSMLTETVHRDGFGATDLSLLDAFLDPHEFTMGGALTPEQGAGAIVNGMVANPGSGIDEFVTETLRNELLGLPLDLAAINIARGRDTGVPPLQVARQRFFDVTGDTDLKPYANWNEFGRALRNPESLVNFVAAYGTHASITGVDTVVEKRAAAQALLTVNHSFLSSSAATSGLNDVDFWMGGIAERNVPFAGFLGTTFNYVFETQLEALQNGDRFYYLSRNIGLNLFHQLEANSFASIIMRTTDATNLPAEVFTTPDHTFDLTDPTTLIAQDLVEEADGTWSYQGADHINMHGTSGNDRMQGGIGDDSLWGYDGDDHIRGGAGIDHIVGGRGHDLLFGEGDDDNIKGGPGNDAINGGSGEDLLFGGSGKDFIYNPSDLSSIFAGTGDDFVLGGAAHDQIAGNEGDDWLEGGGGADLVQGDNANGFQNDPNGGHDVLWGGPGNDDLDAEGGDDIMIASSGVDRFEGMLGFDWVTHRGATAPADADMDNTVFQTPDVGNFRDRYDLVEGLSGWNLNDILRGVGRQDEGLGTGEGHQLTQAHLDRVVGLRALLGGGATPPYAAPFMTANTSNDILLGGAGSDLIEGRAGDDFIDGSAWLNVVLEVRAPAPADLRGRYQSLTELQAAVLDGRLNPGDIHIVREIVTVNEPGAINTAVYAGNAADFDCTPVAGTTTRSCDNVTASGSSQMWRVVHSRPGGRPDPQRLRLSEGTDTLRNIQQLAFADQTVPLITNLLNNAPEGSVTIVGLPARVGVQLVASNNVTDRDGIRNASRLYTWQAEVDGQWGPVSGQPTSSPGGITNDRYTPTGDDVGKRLRVVYTYDDGRGQTGTKEHVNSAPTDPVLTAGGVAPPPPATPIATVTPTSLSFGSQTVDTTSTAQSVTITNTGTANLTVDGATLSGTDAAMFGRSNGCTGALAPTTSCTVDVTFTPSSAGEKAATLTITHNAAGSQSTVALSGSGVAPSGAVLSLPATVDFVQVRLNQTRTQNVRATNTGTAPLVIGVVETTGPFTATRGNCPASLAPGRNCNLSVSFRPTVAGPHTGTLTVNSNATNTPTRANLTGTGR